MGEALRAPFEESSGEKRLPQFRSQILYLIVKKPFNTIDEGISSNLWQTKGNDT